MPKNDLPIKHARKYHTAHGIYLQRNIHFDELLVGIGPALEGRRWTPYPFPRVTISPPSLMARTALRGSPRRGSGQRLEERLLVQLTPSRPNGVQRATYDRRD